MQPGLPGPGSILIKIRGYTEDGAVSSTHRETSSEQGFLSSWQPAICGGPILPNLRNGVQRCKGRIAAGKAAHGGITAAVLLPKIRRDHSTSYSPVRAPSACGWQAELHLAFKPYGNFSIGQRFSTLSLTSNLQIASVPTSSPPSVSPHSKSPLHPQV